MVHTRKVGVGVSYEEIIDYMCMDKGCVSYVVINKYYYQYILYDVGKQPFHMQCFCFGDKGSEYYVNLLFFVKELENTLNKRV